MVACDAPRHRGAVRICCIADLHGRRPSHIPECDLLLIAGDVGPDQYRAAARFFELSLAPWLLRRPAPEIAAIAGNHDHVAERDPRLMRRMPWRYLHNEVIELYGLKIAGSPFSAGMFGSFTRPEEDLSRLWMTTPKDVDVLLVHTPPYGVLDRTRNGTHIGSRSLRVLMRELPHLQLLVCGHVHESAGTQQFRHTLVVNASLCDETYMHAHKPVLVDIIPPERTKPTRRWRR